MTEPGSFADRVKQQADIVRVVGDYVRLKKGGANFFGNCPFHSEKTASFAVHPVRQIYHCFGCGAGGDVFKFVMEMEKCGFQEAVRTVAEKCGIPVPKLREATSEERQAGRERSGLVELHAAATEFYLRELTGTAEGRVAKAYLEDRGLDVETMARFRLGYAPSGGDALYNFLKPKFEGELLEVSGLITRDSGGRPYDRFRRRVMFPIASESGKVIAFGGRALGDDMPKYLNSPETPIYTKSNVLYNLHQARESIRKLGFAILVEGYMDVIGVVRAGVANVVASCGTSLAEPQANLLARFARKVIVNYDPDNAGQAATERSFGILLEKDFDVSVLALPGGADPDEFVRESGAEAYQKLLTKAPAYIEYLVGRARAMDRSTAQAKLAAVNYMMPHLQRMPNRLLRSEWATRVASELEVEEPVLREAMKRAAADRLGSVRPRPEFLQSAVMPVEKRLMQMLAGADEFRQELALQMNESALHQGLETEKILSQLVDFALRGERVDPAKLAESMDEKDRQVLFAALFEDAAAPEREEAQSCLALLRRRRLESELGALQKRLEASPPGEELPLLLAQKQLLQKKLVSLPH